MIQFRDFEGIRYSAITQLSEKHSVNGEKSISGLIIENDDVVHGIDRGWRFNFQGEEYVVIYALPLDDGNNVVLEFDAVHEFFYEMSKSSVNKSISGSHTMQSYLDFIFNGIDFDFRLEVNVKAFKKQNFGYKNRLDLFHDVINQTGLEYSVNGRVVRILERMGDDLTTVVRKNLNLHDLRIEKQIGNFITQQSGFGAWNDEEDHSKGRLSVTYTSPLAEKYGVLEGDPVVDERFSVEENLYSRLESNVENSYKMSVQLTMEDLTKAGYKYKQPRAGDQIMVINELLGFQKQIRIVSYQSEYDIRGRLIDHQVTCNSVGTSNDTIDSTLRSQLNKALEQAERAFEEAERANENATRLAVSADGTVRVFYGATDPSEIYEVREDDIWYDSSGERVIMRRWNGHEWVDLIDLSALHREFEQAQAKLEQFAENFDRIQTRNKQQLDEFEQRLKEFEGVDLEQLRKEIEELRANGITTEEIYEAIEDAGFNRTEIDTIRRTLDGTTEDAKTALEMIDGSRDQIESIHRTLADTTDSAETALEMIGDDGKTHYSRNRLYGATDRQIGFKEPPATIMHNGEGFVAGQTYTISFEALCEMLEQVGVAIDFEYPSYISRELAIEVVPRESELPSVDGKATDSYLVDLYLYPYDLSAQNGWYKSVSIPIDPTASLDYKVALEFRDRIRAVVDSSRVVRWSETPDVVFKGVIQ